MPFFRFHFVEASKLAKVGRKLTDSLQAAIGCPREHIVLELIHSSVVENTAIRDSNGWPFVEVDYFERPGDVRDAVARIVYECLTEAGYANSDIHFRYLQAENYYGNGIRYCRGYIGLLI